MTDSPKKVQVYIHIPFCISKCPYCTACVVTGDSKAKAMYLDALEHELQQALPTLSGYLVTSMYVGGGTPSCMSPDRMAQILSKFKSAIHHVPHMEATIELMPQTVVSPNLTGLSHSGMNRFSLSFQSRDIRDLKYLGCGFDETDVQNSVLLLDKFRMNDVNLDLMYGIPNQRKASFESTLNGVRDIRPTHVSLYPFPGNDDFPNGDESKGGPAQLDFAAEFLEKQGYQRYTRYHFCLPTYECHFFKDRYEGSDFIGFGLGAWSLVDGIAYENTSDWNEYISADGNFEKLVRNAIELSPEQLGQRKHEGETLLVV